MIEGDKILEMETLMRIMCEHTRANYENLKTNQFNDSFVGFSCSNNKFEDLHSEEEDI